MKNILLALVCASSFASTAFAVEDPVPSPKDQRMRIVAYDKTQVVHLSTAVGATLVVGFSPKETITAVAVSDSKDLMALPKGSSLFLKSKTPVPLQPIIVLTSDPDGKVKRYVFEFQTVAENSLGADAAGIYYSVQFIYPAEEAARRRAIAAAEEAKEAAEAEAKAAEYQLKLAHETMEAKARDRDPFSGERNWRYVARGDRSILPLEVFDNGYSTVFRFPGNVRIPSVFVINPDGKEATPNYAVKGDLVQVDTVAKSWRLRDGQTVLCIWNRVFDPVGKNPGTETTSPNVQRVVKDAPR